MTPSPRFLRSTTIRRSGRRVGSLGALIAVGLTLSACGANSQPAASSSPSMPASSAANVPYQLHMDFFSHESHLSSVTDPQVFTGNSTALAGTGPQSIHHAAGVAPAAKTDPSATPLLGADGKSLGITLGQWEKAAGSVSLGCANGRETAASKLTGLVPGGLYSVFVVHMSAPAAGRFTPFGDTAGTTNNFTASAAGTAMPTNTVTGCLTGMGAVLVVWHSDHQSHGALPGTLGVDAHNSLIVQVP